MGSQAGKAIKPVVLELGGSDPAIILEDADIQFACETIAASRLQNNGQSCIGTKRYIVVESVYEEFIEKLRLVFEAYKVGDPMQEDTMIGPIVSKEALEELVGQIDKSVQSGAQVLFGGCLLYTSPSPRDATLSRMPSSA